MKKSRNLTVSVSRTREVDAESLTVSCAARVPAAESEIAAESPELRARLAAAFRACRGAVEAELDRRAAAPVAPPAPRLLHPDEYDRIRDARPAQVDELRRLAALAGTDLDSVLAEHHDANTVESLTRWEADRLIRMLQSRVEPDPAS